MPDMLALDQSVFLAINHLPHTVVTDFIAELFSGMGAWGGLFWILLGVLFLIKEERKNHDFILTLLLLGAISWFVSEAIVKLGFLRPRPTLETGALIIGSTLDSFSFPSTHATIAFAFAYVFSRKFPLYRFWWYLVAVCIAGSRMYLGYHYPLDIIGGIALGTSIGFFLWRPGLQGKKRKKG